jgi:uncharacterized membrane protein YphA (DoxX/SURF4 family)
MPHDPDAASASPATGRLQRLRDRGIASWPGVHVYGVAAIALGLTGLVWGDFASVWQPVPPEFPFRRGLAYIVAALCLASGIALQHRRTAKAGLPVLAVVHLFAALFWLRRVIYYPQIIGTWLGFAEQFALVIAAVVAFASLSPRPSAWDARIHHAGRALFGLCAVVFGLAHFLSLAETIRMVPAWIPPGQRFWALATGVGHLLAGLAIVTGIAALPASRLLTAMILAFGALVWAPSLIATPTSHLVWSGNAINLAVAGAAWILADAIASRREGRQPPGAKYRKE